MSDGGDDVVYGSFGPAQAPGEPIKGCNGHIGQIVNVMPWAGAAVVFVLAMYVASAFEYPFNLVGAAVAVGAIGYSLYLYYAAICYAFDVGDERLQTRKGVFNKVSNNLQLYRVKDVQVREPFIYRPFGLGNVLVVSSDRSTPVLELRAIENPHDVAEVVRHNTQVERLRKNVREVD